MPRRKKGNPVHGWLVLDKPLGMTSNKALGCVKRAFNAQKAGHAGTLDPLASGVLPIAFGEATKTMSYAVDGLKAYRFTVQWGSETSTDDCEGEIVRSSGERANPEQIANVLSRFVGQIEQVPPKFSAIKVAGERAYHLARSGQDVELTARGVEVHSLQIVDHPTPEQTTFETTCGKGTYVRALARDMGRALGVLGHIVALRRIRVGPFNETNAVDLSEIEALVGQGGSSIPESADTFDRTLGEQGEKQKALLLPVAMALQSLPVFTVTSADAASLSLGKSIILRGRDAPIVDGVGYATCRDNVVALVRLEAGQLKPFRVFHTA